MKIRVYKRIRNNAYIVVIKTTDWAQSDVTLFREFGEPEVNVGINGHVRFAKVMSQFPVRGVFTMGDAGSNDLDAETCALAWKDEVVERIKTAVETQRQLKNSFTGEEIHMV